MSGIRKRGIIYLIISLIFASLLPDVQDVVLIFTGFLCVGLFLLSIPYIVSGKSLFSDISSEFLSKFHTGIDIVIVITLIYALTAKAK